MKTTTKGRESKSEAAAGRGEESCGGIISEGERKREERREKRERERELNFCLFLSLVVRPLAFSHGTFDLGLSLKIHFICRIPWPIFLSI